VSRFISFRRQKRQQDQAHGQNCGRQARHQTGGQERQHDGKAEADPGQHRHDAAGEKERERAFFLHQHQDGPQDAQAILTRV
jgi:hypothetical protein